VGEKENPILLMRNGGMNYEPSLPPLFEVKGKGNFLHRLHRMRFLSRSFLTLGGFLGRFVGGH